MVPMTMMPPPAMSCFMPWDLEPGLSEPYIPEVTRTTGGIRDYQESDLGWVELVICMRKAGLPVEALIEYVKLYQQGDETFEARLQLLSEEREKLEKQKAQIELAVNRLNHKISKYQEAVKTGVLNWEENSSCI